MINDSYYTYNVPSLPQKYLDNLMKSRLSRFCWEHAFRVRGRSKRPRSLLPPQSSSVKYSLEHGQPAAKQLG